MSWFSIVKKDKEEKPIFEKEAGGVSFGGHGTSPELFNIKYGKNYGWPYASYGENYYKSLDENNEFEYKKSHEKFGFSEPIFSFVPSIAPTEIIEIDKNFSSKWDKNFLLASLRSQSLFRIVLTKDKNKVVSYEQIRVGKRIRDLIYDKENGLIFLAQENDMGSIGVISNTKK